MEAESGLIVSITLCTHGEAIGPHYTGRVLVRVVGVSITFFLLYRKMLQTLYTELLLLFLTLCQLPVYVTAWLYCEVCVREYSQHTPDM